MYNVSQTWLDLVSQDGHRFELSVVIGESGRLITKAGARITFGGDGILVSQGGAEGGYRGSQIISLRTTLSEFAQEGPGVGACISAELELTMLRPAGEIPRMAVVRPYVRVTDGETYSEWIPQGVFYIDTRSYTKNDDGLDLMTLHCFDAMLMTEQLYPTTTHTWPMTDTAVVQEIADTLGVTVDPRTWEVMTDSVQIPLPASYTMREVLGYIGGMYVGNWVLTYDGQLLLIALDALPSETNYLVDTYGNVLVFGGDRILV